MARRPRRPVHDPDLTDAGLRFRGARLLAAAGAPVAQLVYTDAAGRVVALCLTPAPARPTPRRSRATSAI